MPDNQSITIAQASNNRTAVNASMNYKPLFAALAFSVVGLFFPQLLPAAWKSHGHAPLFFEAAASITCLTLVGRWLEQSLRRHLGRSRREYARRVGRMFLAMTGRLQPLPRPRARDLPEESRG